MVANKNHNNFSNVDLEELFNKKELDYIDKRFIEIISKNKKNNQTLHNQSTNQNMSKHLIDSKITDEEFMDIVLKSINERKIKKQESNLEKYLIKDKPNTKVINNKPIIDEHMNVIVNYPKTSKVKLFFIRFIFTIIICILIIYYLYQFVYV